MKQIICSTFQSESMFPLLFNEVYEKQKCHNFPCVFSPQFSSYMVWGGLPICADCQIHGPKLPPSNKKSPITLLAMYFFMITFECLHLWKVTYFEETMKKYSWLPVWGKGLIIFPDILSNRYHMRSHVRSAWQFFH